MPRFQSPRDRTPGDSSRPALDLIGWFTAAALVLSIGACSQMNNSEASPSASTTADGQSSLVAPILMDISMLDGTTQIVKLSDGVVLVPSSDEEIELWGATFQDDTIAYFQPGSVEYELTLRPFIQPTAVGQTEVTLLNTGTSQEVIFTLIVNE